MVQTGDSVMIGGFIISGTAPRSVLIRGFGPTLADWGVTGGTGVGLVGIDEIAH